MDYVKEAQKLGYEIELLGEDDDGKVYTVKGYGVDTTYHEKNNKAEWKFLITPEAHEHREKMYRHNLPSVAEAKARGLPEELGDDFTMEEEEIYESAIKASIGAGLITKEDAKRMREQRAVVAAQ